ncbi:MAG: formate dehydrogenase, partial [bacterium]
MKIRITKTVLWLLAGFGSTIILLRILHGPGSVTALTDILPWGLWKGWGVVALVPIGGAGFTLAMLVYIFHLDRFKPVVRGAVLLGLMCYTSVALGLSMDIGIWWRIVFPVFHWQFHSVLFEIAWCIMLYLLVLVAEFGHTVLQRFGWRRALSVLEKFSIGFVIIG